LTESDHVGFVVPDLEEAIRFFVEVIGATVLFRLGPYQGDDEDGRNWMSEQLRIPPGSTLNAVLLRLTDNLGLELYEIDAAEQGVTHVPAYELGAPHLSFRVSDFDAAYEYLRQLDGITLHGEPQTPDEGHLAGMRWLHFETPWGLVLEIDEWPVSPYGREQA
jgi:catechol 2,3-dioxygenase-like lactoylglutathione lyase family enzyme